MLTLKAEENSFEEQPEHVHEKQHVVLVNTISDLRSTDVTIGSEVGNTCPVCRKGKVIETGGCNAQLKCGL